MEIIVSEFDGKSGIYCIENIDNGKKYVGSSKNMLHRLYSHRAYLRNNTHANYKLQNSWNKHGEQAFRCYVLEVCPLDILLDREQFYIDTLSPWYNITLEVQEVKMSAESRVKMSKSRIEGFKRGTVKLYQEKEIHQYTLSGEYIQSFCSIKEAALKTGCSRSSINRFLEGLYKKGGDFLWSLTKEPMLKPYQKRKHDNSFLNKPILVHDIIEDTSIEYESLTTFCRLIGKNVNSVRQAVKDKRPYLKRYMITRICRSHE